MLDPYLIPQNKLQLPSKYTSPIEYTEALIDFIEAHKHWTTLHIVDFITLNQWDTVLEETWRQVLLPKHESEDDWIHSIIKIASGSDLNESWPESLKEFIQQARDIALPRFNQNGSIN
ncbi:hypothetical protein EDC96DRAFT_157225 [Choanephora cucurbitarum]|nr:hypothetical protein EDC96DRAFT_157225 [Choanephora cucurbitarum]